MCVRTCAGRVGAKHASPLQATLLTRIGLGLTLLLATGLRFYRLAGQSLWSDEGNSVALARAGLAEIAARTARDIHPPLYYWLLHGWMRILDQPTGPSGAGFQGSEVAVRSLSAWSGVLLVAVVYVLGARLFTQPVGLLAAFIAAVSPFQVYYAQEARMYALLALLGALVVWATVELMSNEEREMRTKGQVCSEPASRSWLLIAGHSLRFTRYSLLYVLSVAVGLYTHYAFPVILVATNLAALVWLWQDRGEGLIARRLGHWLVLQLIPLALYLPWLPIAWRQLTTWPAPSASDAGTAWVTVWRTLTFGPAAAGVSDLWMVGFALLGLVGVARLLKRSPLPRTILVLLYLGLPVGLTLALYKPAYLKFLLVASPGLCLLLALGAAGARPGRSVLLSGWLGASLAVAAAWGPLTAYYTDPAVARDDYRGMARYLEAIAGPEDAIILDAAGQQEVFGYYYHADTPIYPLPRRRPLDPEATVAELDAILARARHIYALYWATGESDPAGLIEGWLDSHAFKATDVWVGNVRLVSYAAPRPSTGDLLRADLRLGDHVTLTGYRLFPTQMAPGEIVRVQLRWTANAPLDTRYVVFVQALDSANHLVGQRDAEPVISTLDWEPGLPVPDRHGLLIEAGTPPGEYQVIAGLYDAATGQRLPTASGDTVELGMLRVERPVPPLPEAALRFHHPAGVDLGPLRLLGYDRYKLGHRYDPDTPLHPGDPLHVVLYWQARARPQTDWLVELHLAPVTGLASPVAEGIFPAAGVYYPTRHWEPGEVVRAQFDLFLPGDVAPGRYRVSMRLRDEAGAPGTDTFTLVSIPVE